jgi:hypothetical protein
MCQTRRHGDEDSEQERAPAATTAGDLVSPGVSRAQNPPPDDLQDLPVICVLEALERAIALGRALLHKGVRVVVDATPEDELQWAILRSLSGGESAGATGNPALGALLAAVPERLIERSKEAIQAGAGLLWLRPPPGGCAELPVLADQIRCFYPEIPIVAGPAETDEELAALLRADPWAVLLGAARVRGRDLAALTRRLAGEGILCLAHTPTLPDLRRAGELLAGGIHALIAEAVAPEILAAWGRAVRDALERSRAPGSPTGARRAPQKEGPRQ